MPIFATVAEAVAETGADTSMIMVPAPGTKAAILEAAEAGIGTIVAITEGVPLHDMVAVYNTLYRRRSRRHATTRPARRCSSAPTAPG